MMIISFNLKTISKFVSCKWKRDRENTVIDTCFYVICREKILAPKAMRTDGPDGYVSSILHSLNGLMKNTRRRKNKSPIVFKRRNDFYIFQN